MFLSSEKIRMMSGEGHFVMTEGGMAKDKGTWFFLMTGGGLAKDKGKVGDKGTS